MKQTDARLAALRREGHGVWYITFIVDGFDEVFTQAVSGRYSETFAEAIAKQRIALELNIDHDYITLKESRIEG